MSLHGLLQGYRYLYIYTYCDRMSQTYERRENLLVAVLHLQAQGLFYVCTSKRVIRTAKSLYYFNFKSHCSLSVRLHLSLIPSKFLQISHLIFGWSTEENPHSKWSVVQKDLETHVL
jgi:hypothetical protein